MTASNSRLKTACSPIKKLMDPNVATPYSSSYMDVLKAEAVDKYTFRVTYKEPFSPALESWAMGMIPKHLLEGKDINTDRVQQEARSEQDRINSRNGSPARRSCSKRTTIISKAGRTSISSSTASFPTARPCSRNCSPAAWTSWA